jgi:integrase
VVLSLSTGVRTEEIRALGWSEVDTGADTIDVWCSVRDGGETKTRKSRRTLGLSREATEALRRHRALQARDRFRAGELWQENGLVFATRIGTPVERHNVLRGFRRIAKEAGLDPMAWTPRELRHMLVSLLSDAGVSSEEISLLVGHDGTEATERVYRHQLRPVRRSAAEAMGRLLAEAEAG